MKRKIMRKTEEERKTKESIKSFAR